jgi:hypothetical protein
MSIRALLAATLLALLVGCGGEQQSEVSVLAPAWIDEDVQQFEHESGCRVDLRTYDEQEELAPIAERRDADVIAELDLDPIDQAEPFVRVTLSGGVVVTIPERLASAFTGPKAPARPRSISWVIRPEGDNPDCARRWLAYATSQ